MMPTVFTFSPTGKIGFCIAGQKGIVVGRAKKKAVCGKAGGLPMINYMKEFKKR